jgi:predicted dehydrogenase
MLRGALIGLGNVALKVHLPGWAQRDDVEITAVTDVERARRATIADMLPSARWYDSADDLFAQERLDFVDICSPPGSHASLISRALARGFHVLCEKPLVCSPDELRTVTDAARTHGRVLHTVHNWHYAPIIKRATDLVEQGAIGRTKRVVWETLRTQPAPAQQAHEGNWRLNSALSGGGILTDHGWHVFYLIQRWIGEAPTSVSARLETRRHVDWAVEDTATVRVAFPSATAEIFLTWAADRRGNDAALIGSDSRIELRDETLVLRQNGDEQRWLCPPALSKGSVHPDWFDPVIAQFVAEVGGVAPPDGNMMEASLCTALESSARESNRQGGRAIGITIVS